MSGRAHPGLKYHTGCCRLGLGVYRAKQGVVEQHGEGTYKISLHGWR